MSKNPLCRVRQHSFVEIDHMVIVSLTLIQEGQLPVSGERMSTNMVNCLEDYKPAQEKYVRKKICCMSGQQFNLWDSTVC